MYIVSLEKPIRIIHQSFTLFLIAFSCEYIDASFGMGYGTISSPLLIIMGFPPLSVVPSILFSQMLGGSVASIFHHRYKNAIFKLASRDSKVVYTITLLGVIAAITAVFIAINIPRKILTGYIGLLVLTMGVILLFNFKFQFSWKKIALIGLISAFNKGIPGGGFGPVVTGGQLLSGQDYKNSIGCTTLAEVPICLVAFLIYLLTKSIINWNILLPLTLGSICATPFGAYTTKRTPEKKIKLILGLLITCLGIFTLWKTIH